MLTESSGSQEAGEDHEAFDDPDLDRNSDGEPDNYIYIYNNNYHVCDSSWDSHIFTHDSYYT